MPQFFTTLCVISAVLVISQLMRISDVLINFGISWENVLLPFLFIILPFLTFTIPMSYMFAVMLGFSRLSADGEFPALLAAGYSLQRCALPVMGVALLLYGIGAFCASNLEPWGRREMVNFYHRKAQTELDHLLKYKLQSGVFVEDFIGYTLFAEKVSKDHTQLTNVMMAPGDRVKTMGDFTLLAPSATVTGSVERGDLRMNFNFGVIYSATSPHGSSSVTKFRRANLDILRLFQGQIFGSSTAKDDYRSYTPFQLWKYLESAEKTAKTDRQLTSLRKAKYLFHYRIATPFVVIVFAMLGMVFGVQDQRHARGSAWLFTILSIIVTYILLMSFKYLAENDLMYGALAAWMPNIILFFFAAFLLYQKNRLPPGEATLDLRHIPGVGRLIGYVKN